MNICKRCVETHHPDYFNHVNPDSISWSTAVCYLCGVRSDEILTTTKELLDNPRPKPKSQQPKRQIVRKAKGQSSPHPETEATPSETKNTKYQYMIIDWQDGGSHHMLENKNGLVEEIKTLVFKRSRPSSQLDVYKLTPLPHKAEIKIEVGE